MELLERNESPQGLRVIKTARDKDRINEAVKNGFRPLIKKVKPSSKIRSKYAVVQNTNTGEIEVIGDYRSKLYSDNLVPNRLSRIFPEIKIDYEIVIDWTFYYPNNFKSPFAAYLIPKDIQIGERVLLEDLIEDYVGGRWNQGDTYRLGSCEAIWNGKDLEIQYDPRVNRSDFVG
jgi:hypothetical protein